MRETLDSMCTIAAYVCKCKKIVAKVMFCDKFKKGERDWTTHFFAESITFKGTVHREKSGWERFNFKVFIKGGGAEFFRKFKKLFGMYKESDFLHFLNWEKYVD